MFVRLIVLYSVILLYGCGDPVREQLTEVDRLKVLAQKTAEIVLQQEALIKSEIVKFENFKKRNSEQLTQQAVESTLIYEKIEFCKLAIKIKTHPWKSWDKKRKKYEVRIRLTEGLAGDWSFSFKDREKLKRQVKQNRNLLNEHLKQEPPNLDLTVGQCQSKLPKFERDLELSRAEVNKILLEGKQRTEAFVEQENKMIVDLAIAKNALDSLNTMHTNAVFVLSKMGK